MVRNYRKKVDLQEENNRVQILFKKQSLLLKINVIRFVKQQKNLKYFVLLSMKTKDFDSKNCLPKLGRNTALTATEENVLVDILSVCAKWGYPFRLSEVCQIIKKYLIL